jgi:hypothetical protein
MTQILFEFLIKVREPGRFIQVDRNPIPGKKSDPEPLHIA